MLDRTIFFDEYRNQFGSLKQQQVDGLNNILDSFDKTSLLLPQAAYILATIKHETAHTFQPIREYGRGRGKKYGTTYYGRGYVQLTWKSNYEAMTPLIQTALNDTTIDLVANPDLALRPDIAWVLIEDGMMKGRYNPRGHGLDYYVNRTKKDYVGARYTVNLNDKAQMLAGYADKFEKILDKALP